MGCSKPVAIAAGALLVAGVLALEGGDPQKASAAEAAAADRETLCQASGAWVDPDSGAKLHGPDLMRKLAGQRVVLLGETHTAPEDHRWQLHMLAGLHALAPEMVIGFEMFPRGVQEALDRWSQGNLSEREFLTESRWAEVWGYTPAPYLPLFHFARQNRIPMVALNVDRSLVSRVGQEGWAAVPPDAREGVTDPAAAEEDYRQSLAEVYLAKLTQGRGLSSQHGSSQHGGAADGSDDLPEISDILEDEKFQRFVEAQLTWDRAMAERLFSAGKTHPEALLVGVMGRGHAEYGHGVPHQLADLGENSVTVLLPIERGPACETIASGIADAVFLVDPIEPRVEAPPKPRLGVIIESTNSGVEVREVVAGSVAEASGLLAGDVILRAAEIPVTQNADLIDVIQRQAPGTWLPLQVRRASEETQIIAKFPTSTE